MSGRTCLTCLTVLSPTASREQCLVCLAKTQESDWTFKDRLVAAMQVRAVSAAEVARVCRVTVATLMQQWLAGRKVPTGVARLRAEAWLAGCAVQTAKRA